MGVQAQVFLSGKSHFRLDIRHLNRKDAGTIFKIGVPGAATNLYLTVRGLLVNRLLEIYVGSVAISAFATANNLLGIFWAIPNGMLAVSRMLISVSMGEEDRQTLTDTMRVMLRRYVPLMCAVSAVIIASAVPMTRIFYQDTADKVFDMTVWGLRILPLCMPLSIINSHLTCYNQSAGRHWLVHIVSLLDGALFVTAFSALLLPVMGINGVYAANVLNGIMIMLVFFGYAWNRSRHLPGNMGELIVIPDDFGAAPDDRLDVSIRSMDDVVSVAESIHYFCRRKGNSETKAGLAGLCMEEMAGNVVIHGFKNDQRRHSVDVRIVIKDQDVILRLTDDCAPFDPGE